MKPQVKHSMYTVRHHRKWISKYYSHFKKNQNKDTKSRHEVDSCVTEVKLSIKLNVF